jgi:peptidoglycan hydrolase-like amidase
VRRRAIGGVVALLAALLPALAVAVQSAAAYPGPSVDLVGHGFGHGRGMGQYGALGNALAGWSYSQVLDHYYGGTVMGSVDPATPITVRLTALDGAGTLVQEVNGNLGAAWSGGAVAGQHGLRVDRTVGGLVVYTSAVGCAGPWTVASGLVVSDVTITPANPASNDTNEMIQTCPPVAPQNPYRQWVRGQVVVKSSPAQTWNILPVDSYVRGVVPRESPAAWGTVGGQAALQAQAVAARSYALAYGTPICDSTTCQVYGGRAVVHSDGAYQDLEGAGPYVATTDAAVTATAGQVRSFVAGGMASTEYSSSSGGFTAGGRFPAVDDAGDATPSKA